MKEQEKIKAEDAEASKTAETVGAVIQWVITGVSIICCGFCICYLVLKCMRWHEKDKENKAKKRLVSSFETGQNAAENPSDSEGWEEGERRLRDQA